MDQIDHELLMKTSKGLPLTSEPFKEIADEMGITTQEAISRLVKLREEGVIRRFGVSIKPNDVGLVANALVAWKVPETRMQEVGSLLAQRAEVTHCYERYPAAGRWEYNLYTVMHAPKREAIQQLVAQLAQTTGIGDYVILFSVRDLKEAPKEARAVEDGSHA
jgi:DNA-binding Lrp family transcriptional regulator